MAFILSRDLGEVLTPEDFEAQKAKWPAYLAYLESHKDKIPSSAWTFATARWHYDTLDNRCLHDSWVEHLLIQEVPVVPPNHERVLGIEIRLLGLHHNGHTTLTYERVKSYQLETPAEFTLPPFGVGHGDWRYDEVRLSETGLVLHEIEFSRGSRWLIECQDIRYSWTAMG